jgi:glycosidase
MQWNNGEQAGFTDGIPWLKINENYKRINVESQDKDENSVRSFYKKMIEIRSKSDVLKQGAFTLIKATKSLFLYERKFDGRRIIVILNFSKRIQKAPYFGNVLISNYDKKEYDGVLQPYESIVLEAAK